jgi:thiamine-phosphate pyrophosphorylase
MLDDATPALLIALQTAWSYARQRQLSAVEPIHLFQAFLNEMEGRAAQALQRAGLDLDRAAQSFGPPEPMSPPMPAESGAPLGPACQLVLNNARQLAREVSEDDLITTDQALLALVQHDTELRDRLVGLGLSFERLQALIAAKQPPIRLDEPLLFTEPVERVQADRILDAAANRAREALRVVEDYCRFVLDDAFLSRELKDIRHELTEILGGLPFAGLLEARDTLHDVGTDLTTTRERQRHSLLDVVQANLKRLEEALRSLEEFAKLQEPGLGATLEKLRYRAYTLEKAVVLGTSARRRLAEARLYVLLTGSQCAAALDWTIREAAAGGAQVFQLREKDLSDRDLLERAGNVRRWTRGTETLFIVNDRPDIARLVEADGVHLGQDDMSIKDARRILGPDGLIGVSTHTLEQARQAVRDGASYIGVGPTFPSDTKSFPELAGLEFVRQATAETTLPAFVIGGIRVDNLAAALDAGARRVAVSHCIGQANDPRAVAAQLRQILDQV